MIPGIIVVLLMVFANLLLTGLLLLRQAAMEKAVNDQAQVIEDILSGRTPIPSSPTPTSRRSR